MKTKILFAAAIAAVAMVACSSPKVSDQTAISGTFGSNAPDVVKIEIPGASIDTVVSVKNGKFSIKVPTYRAGLSRITAGNIITRFIADGTPLNFVYDSTKATITSKHPDISAEMNYEEFREAFTNLNNQYVKEVTALGDNAPEDQINALYDKVQAKSDSICKAVIAKDNGSVITVMALGELQYSLSASEMKEILSNLDSSLLENEQVARMVKANDSMLATAEGNMFADFESNGDKFSNYIGKGKYMLVDFWAPWCGPCKAEMPNIRNVYEKYKGDNFDVLGVEVWQRPGLNAADTAKAYNMGWTIMYNVPNVATDTYGIQGIPHIILFGPDGKIIKRDLRGDDIEKTVAQYVQPTK